MSNPTYSRLHLKLGRPAAGAVGAAQFLRFHDKMSQLMPTVKKFLELKQDCIAALPPYFESLEVMQLEEGVLTLSTPNAALSVKLRQMCPQLVANLQVRGWQIKSIRLKVQVKPVVEKSTPKKQIKLSEHALQALDELERRLERDPHNTALCAALQRLLKNNK